MARRKQSLPFDKAGGVVAIQRQLIESGAYLKLSAQAKALLILMQLQWRNEKPVDFGIREAMAKVPCAKRTAQNAFRELQARGFIELVEESVFNSRTQSKSRTWRLTWLPFLWKEPTNEWKQN
jgi:hypothetical protein